MSKPRLLFTHVPKTAGSTLRAIVERQYPQSTCVNIRKGNPFKNLEILKTIAQTQQNQVSCVIGHLYYGAHVLFPQGENIYMTMLRHPIKRIVSNYYFARSKPILPGYELAKDLSLLEYANHPTVNGLTIRYLAGMQGETPETLSFVQAIDEKSLEQAKANLRNHYKAIGFTEEFDLSILMMKKNLGWGNVYYHAVNTGKKRGQKEKKSQLTPEMIAELEAACPLEMALYRYACELYEAQKDAYGREKLAADLVAFQTMNRRISPFLGFIRNFHKSKLRIRRLLRRL